MNCRYIDTLLRISFLVRDSELSGDAADAAVLEVWVESVSQCLCDWCCIVLMVSAYVSPDMFLSHFRPQAPLKST